MLTVATWNLENLFRNGVPGGPTTAEAYEGKLAALTRTIDALAPDVLALQEVGQPEALADLADRLAPPPGGSWRQELSNHPDDRGIRVGFLSGLPVLERTDLLELADGLAPLQTSDVDPPTTRMGRGALHVALDTGGPEPLQLLTCHLKSKLLSYPGGRFTPRSEDERARYGAYALYRRAAEATTVRVRANALLDAAGQERRVVVLGDLNDVEQAATTQTLLGPGGSEIGAPGYETPDRGDAWRLWNVAPLIAEQRRYSRVYRGRKELIDHVLVSQAVLRDVESADSVVDDGVPSVDDQPASRRNARGSDHAPVLVRLRTP